ncbi:MAG: hypothetical protein COU08_00055 [Candidatus Harrisonbacteria bacterium CG10_big_fil_rev_8_21_14_0_10_42_17]|uniref:Uncharacterized protein n=1 Tax=Candidatus Harrisonbacteria bacterium CG10_big_fil_rev_8_21_14_0_10_42_17 TaxID=1974584 RepID=A0A2M6WJC6_9BACT|nr:MAG: hypothetical protein COU08_00055 [Candidatus Harrisonbacteria bacterium CG10_big_fil_rev_8_21_14_0_10_42_17]
MSERKVSIHCRLIVFEVVVPEDLVWPFAQSFSDYFPLIDSISGASKIRPIDSYFNHPNGWHVRVTVPDLDSYRFSKFLDSFCTSHGLIFQQACSSSGAW